VAFHVSHQPNTFEVGLLRLRATSSQVSNMVSFETTGDAAKIRGLRVSKVCLKIDA
jgi:hypothetical protein